MLAEEKYIEKIAKALGRGKSLVSWGFGAVPLPAAAIRVMLIRGNRRFALALKFASGFNHAPCRLTSERPAGLPALIRQTDTRSGKAFQPLKEAEDV